MNDFISYLATIKCESQRHMNRGCRANQDGNHRGGGVFFEHSNELGI